MPDFPGQVVIIGSAVYHLVELGWKHIQLIMLSGRHALKIACKRRRSRLGLQSRYDPRIGWAEI
jgi:hypothetical protein